MSGVVSGGEYRSSTWVEWLVGEYTGVVHGWSG
jgi:hypothetical protein